jgi:hypothetical protein
LADTSGPPGTPGTPALHPATPEKGVWDILVEAWALYRRHARALVLTCAVVFVPASVLKSCALSAIMAPGSSAAAAVEAARGASTTDLEAANAALQDAYARHADGATLARLKADQARARDDLERHHRLAAGEAMGTFILFVLGIVGALVTFFFDAITVLFITGALTISVVDRALGGATGWRGAWTLLLGRLAPLLTAVLPAALVTAFAFAFFWGLGLAAALLFAFVAPVVLIEGRRGGDAIRRSVELVLSDWLRVALMIIVVVVAGKLAETVAGILVPSWALFVSSFLGDLVMLALLPLPTLGMVLLYLDVRRRRDGFTDDQLRGRFEALKAS